MATNADLLLDTSAAIALLLEDHESHRAVRERVTGRTIGLAGHARYETFSVLTRLPPPDRLSPVRAAQLIEESFPRSLSLDVPDDGDPLAEWAARGIAGGAVYDALVAHAAARAGLPLLSVDRRAAGTYRQVGVSVELLRG